MSGWRIVPLPDARLREAWPLVRLRYPDWTLDTWLGEARTLMADERPAGLLAAETAGGYIYAVCGYVVDRPGLVGEELSLPIVASIRWRGFDDPLERLVDAVESIGRDHGCRRACVSATAIAAAGDTTRWQQLGYTRRGARLQKALPANPSPLPPTDIRSFACP